MKKIIVILSGGLGNQLFQFFSALEYAEKMKISKIEIGIGFYNSSNEPRTFDLIDCIDFDKVKIYFKDIEITIRSNVFHKVIFRVANRIPGHLAAWLFINNDNVDQSKLMRSCLHVGYKQDQSLLPSRETISNVFREPKIIHKFDVGIHIRRGDYLKPKFSNHGLVDLSSIKNIVDKIGLIGRKIIVFSDSDVKDEFFLVFSNYADLDICFAADLMISATEEFYLMRACKHMVCSNSTFSWWAVYSSSFENKAYLPRYWYKGVEIPDQLFFSKSILYDVNLI